MVAVSYDSTEKLVRFRRKYDIPYTLLSDQGSVTIRELGLLNETYEPDSPYYGVAWPGMFLLDAHGRIRAKFAEENYRDRPPFPDVIEAAKKMKKSVEHR